MKIAGVDVEMTITEAREVLKTLNELLGEKERVVIQKQIEYIPAPIYQQPPNPWPNFNQPYCGVPFLPSSVLLIAENPWSEFR